jgi:hypothetical protein
MTKTVMYSVTLLLIGLKQIVKAVFYFSVNF